MIIYSKQYETIDQICFALFGNTQHGIVEKVYQLNLHLDLNPVLALGTMVQLPDAFDKNQSTKKLINIWD